MTTTVLIIDDQQLIHEVFEYALRNMDCRVDCASSGTQGLQLLAGGSYDVVFLDLNLCGELDGVETLKQMKRGGSRVPVYIITGFYENYASALMTLAKQYEIDFEVIRKPIDVTSLHDIINALKHQPDARRPLDRQILVIDDDAAIRKSFQLALEDCPVRVDAAASGAAGLAMAARLGYDLIYLDLKMPGMNGVETLRQIRAINATVPVYIITAFYPEFLDQLNAPDVQQLGFELLRKPIGSEDIMSLTMNILAEPVTE